MFSVVCFYASHTLQCQWGRPSESLAMESGHDLHWICFNFILKIEWNQNTCFSQTVRPHLILGQAEIWKNWLEGFSIIHVCGALMALQIPCFHWCSILCLSRCHFVQTDYHVPDTMAIYMHHKLYISPTSCVPGSRLGYYGYIYAPQVVCISNFLCSRVKDGNGKVRVARHALLL
jgi:hypothetical protein